MDATASGGTPVATGGAFADREVVGGSAVEAADDAVVAVDLPSEELSEATLDALGVQPPQGAAAPSVGAPSASSRPRARKKSSGKGIQEVRGKAAEARDIYVAEFERAGEVDLAAAGVPIGELEDGDGVAMDLTFAPEDVGLDEAAVEAEMEADLGAGVVELAPSRSDLAPIGAARRSSGVLRRGSAPPAETKKAGRAAGALWSDTNLSTALARLRKDAETRGWSWAQQFSKSTAGALVQVSVPTDLLPEALDWIRSQGLVDGVQEVVSGADGKSTIRLTVLEPAK